MTAAVHFPLKVQYYTVFGKDFESTRARGQASELSLLFTKKKSEIPFLTMATVSSLPSSPYQSIPSSLVASKQVLLANNNMMMGSDTESEREDLQYLLLEQRESLTQALHELPYDLVAYIERAAVYADLGYPDLAAGDSYRALLLCDEVRNEEYEYHELALETLQDRVEDGLPSALHSANRHGYGHTNLSDEVAHMNLDEPQKTPLQVAHMASTRCYQILSISLLLCGCLKSAYEFCLRGLEAEPQDEDLLQAKEYIENMAKCRLKVKSFEIGDLPDQGLVRREIYPWNDHEPDRFAPETIDFLNNELRSIGAKCEVKVTELPVLLESASAANGYEHMPTNKQLGLFATEDLAVGDTVLYEHTLLAANNRLKDSFCDACSTEFPASGLAASSLVNCPECVDITFCDEFCLKEAQESYHPAVCDKDLDTIAKDVSPTEKTNALYLLLLSRSLALSVTQEIHPLDLKQIKYIWGDFVPSAENAVSLSLNAPPPPIWTLPFSFADNIAGPLHFLEKMDIDIFATLPQYDFWVFNTLYAKFRGTASARCNSRTGHPEVAAVHPLWCLANHDCDPNVQWEWSGRMRLWVRDERVGGRKGGIRKGEEIMNHYCDIELPVKDRREWASGSLGGWCMCARCRREAAEDEKQALKNENGHHVNGEHQTNGD